jgi:hypothetical protein
MLDREWQVHPGASVRAALVIFLVTLSSIVGMWNVMPASKLWVSLVVFQINGDLAGILACLVTVCPG